MKLKFLNYRTQSIKQTLQTSNKTPTPAKNQSVN